MSKPVAIAPRNNVPHHSVLKSPNSHPSGSRSGSASLGTSPTSPPNHNGFYIPKVSFETFTARNPEDFSFTLQSKSARYRHTRRSRTFVVCTDDNDYSVSALDWLIESLVEDGDELVALRVLPIESGPLNKMTFANIEKQGTLARDEANRMMREIMERNLDKSISITVEFVVGKVQDAIQRIVSMYKPDSLIVGTRGQSKMKSMFLGSISKYCLQHSPVPVTVVRTQNKVQASLQKRVATHSSRSYIQLLERSRYPAANLSDEALAELSSPAIVRMEMKRGNALDPNDLIAGPMGVWLTKRPGSIGDRSFSSGDVDEKQQSRRRNSLGGWKSHARRLSGAGIIDSLKNKSNSSLGVDTDTRSVKSEGEDKNIGRSWSRGSWTTFGSLGSATKRSFDLRRRQSFDTSRRSLDDKR